jgi:hypothetical protein
MPCQQAGQVQMRLQRKTRICLNTSYFGEEPMDAFHGGITCCQAQAH